MVSPFYNREKARKPRKIVHPNRRCPRCNEYNLTVAINRKRYGLRYFMACVTPGCWYFGPEARTKNGAIKKWNEEAAKCRTI